MMRICIWLLILLLIPIEVDAFNGSSNSYTLTHGNINFITVHDNSSTYTADYSIVQQPTLNSNSSSYTAYLGFYYGGILDFLREFNDWWFLAIVLALLSSIIILYLALRQNKFMQIPLSIGIILLILITLNVLLLGIEVFAGSQILSNISGIVEVFFTVMLYLLPFIFMVWCIFFISFLIKKHLMTKK